MSPACARRMLMLQYGQEPVPKHISVRGAGDELLWEPIIGAVVETDIGYVLLETGIGRAVLDDSAALNALYPGPSKPWGLDGSPLTSALTSVGISIDEIRLAAVSHLHCDHTGGVRELGAAGIPVVVQRSELEYALERATLADGYYPPDFAGAVEWRELDGDAQLAPGLSVVATPGHAPGHMSYRVDLAESGTWLLAVDAGDLAENFTDRRPPGQTVLPDDLPRAMESLDRLLELQRQSRARLVPGHDQLFWDAVRHPVGGHR